MPRRAQPPEPPPLALKLPREEARSQLTKRITKGQELHDAKEGLDVFNREYSKWDDYNKTLLAGLFTNDSVVTEYVWYTSGGVIVHEESDHDVYKRNQNALEKKLLNLESLLEQLEVIPLAANVSSSASRPSTPVSTNRVFVVHGHDKGIREMVVRFLERLALSPIVLHEQPSGGKTVIEKLEQHSDVAFAVVLLTPDDQGCSQGEADLQQRARQNVILELGFFIGRLGRERVCALHKGKLELPTDILGVVYVSLDDGDGWRFSLAKELRQAGFEVDLNRVM